MTQGGLNKTCARQELRNSWDLQHLQQSCSHSETSGSEAGQGARVWFSSQGRLFIVPQYSLSLLPFSKITVTITDI